jgi:hypothetical protein
VREVHAQVYSNRKNHRMNNDEKPTALPDPNRVPPFGLDVDLPTESNTAGGSFHVSLGRGAWRWKLGGDHFNLHQNAHRTVSRRDTGTLLFEDEVWPDAHIDDTGLYAQSVWFRDAVDLSGTVRVDRVAPSARDLTPFFLAHTTGDPDRRETNWSAAVSGLWHAGDRWVLTAGLGRAVRSASVLERYSDRFPSTRFQVAAEFLGDPGLAPEVGYQADLGTEAALGRGTFSVDVFYRKIDDYITVRPDPSVPRRLPLSPPTVFRYVNGDGAIFWGGELELDQRLGRSFLGRLSASYLWGEDQAFDEPAFGVPPLTGTVGLPWQPEERFWLDGEVVWADRQDRVAASLPPFVSLRILWIGECGQGIRILLTRTDAARLQRPQPPLQCRRRRPEQRICLSRVAELSDLVEIRDQPRDGGKLSTAGQLRDQSGLPQFQMRHIDHGLTSLEEALQCGGQRDALRTMDEEPLAESPFVLIGRSDDPSKVGTREEVQRRRALPHDHRRPVAVHEMMERLHHPTRTEDDVREAAVAEKVLGAQLRVHQIEPAVLAETKVMCSSPPPAARSTTCWVATSSTS